MSLLLPKFFIFIFMLVLWHNECCQLLNSVGLNCSEYVFYLEAAYFCGEKIHNEKSSFETEYTIQ